MINRFTVRTATGYEHTPLSNFWMSDIHLPPWRWCENVDGRARAVRWPSVEHFYQAAKCMYVEEEAAIRNAETPGKAKKLGRRAVLSTDFEEKKLLIMRMGLFHKFQPNTHEGEYLLATGDQELVEGNTWGDRFWGVDGTGQNWLGHLLMARRAELRAEVLGQQALL